MIETTTTSVGFPRSSRFPASSLSLSLSLSRGTIKIDRSLKETSAGRGQIPPFPPSLPRRVSERGPAAARDVCRPEGTIPGNHYGPSNFFTITMPLVTLPATRRCFTAGPRAPRRLSRRFFPRPQIEAFRPPSLSLSLPLEYFSPSPRIFQPRARDRRARSLDRFILFHFISSSLFFFPLFALRVFVLPLISRGNRQRRRRRRQRRS